MSAPKKKLPWWGGLLIGFGILFLLGLLGVGGLVWWAYANKDRLVADTQKVIVEASAFAETHEQKDCVDEGLRRLTGCRGITCEVSAKIFVDHCIQAAALTPGFCASTPPSTEIIKTATWATMQCRGVAQNVDSGRCTRLYQSVSEACHKR